MELPPTADVNVTVSLGSTSMLDIIFIPDEVSGLLILCGPIPVLRSISILSDEAVCNVKTISAATEWAL